MSIFAKKTDKKSDKKVDFNQHQNDDASRDLDIDIDDVERTSPGPTSSTGYGIADAMRLMRSLPTDQNIDLIVRVVRVTLGSVNVRIEDIIEDASRRQKAIQDNIAALHEKVADLEEELEARRRDIAAQEADFKETSSVKERLLLAEKAAHPSTGHRMASHTPSPDFQQAGPSAQPPPPPPTRALPKPTPRE